MKSKLLERYREKVKKLEASERKCRQQILADQKELSATISFYKAAIEEKNKRIDQLEEHLRRLGITKP